MDGVGYDIKKQYTGDDSAEDERERLWNELSVDGYCDEFGKELKKKRLEIPSLEIVILESRLLDTPRKYLRDRVWSKLFDK